MNNPTVHFYLTRNMKDTDVSNAVECSWIEFKNIFAKHEVQETKDGLMFNPWITMDATVGRGAENTIGTDLICLDFDDDSGWTMEEAIGVFRKYEHYGFTSYNHLKNGKDRFKIVLPLSDIVTTQEIRDRRDSIYEKYAGVDSCCLSISRGFYIPSCPKERVDDAFTWSNPGELLDITKFEKRVYIPHQPLVISEVSDEKKKWVLESLSKVYIGHEPTWRNIGLAMCAAGYTLEDFCFVTLSGLMKQKSQADCVKKWRGIEDDTKNVQISFGYIINLLKEKGHIYKTYEQDPSAVTNKRKDGQGRMKQLQEKWSKL